MKKHNVKEHYKIFQHLKCNHWLARKNFITFYTQERDDFKKI